MRTNLKSLIGEMLDVARLLLADGHAVGVDSDNDQCGPRMEVRSHDGRVLEIRCGKFLGRPKKAFEIRRLLAGIPARKAATASSGGLLDTLRELIAEPPIDLRHLVTDWLTSNAKRLGVKIVSHPYPEDEAFLVRFVPENMPEPLIVLAIEHEQKCGLSLSVIGIGGPCRTGIEPSGDTPDETLKSIVVKGLDWIKRFGLELIRSSDALAIRSIADETLE